MVSVGDDAGPKPRIGQLLPDVVGMTADGAVGPVAQVRAQSGAGVDSRRDLVGFGGRVSDRHHHPVGGNPFDELDSPVDFGRQRHQPDPTPGRLLQPAELVVVGPADMFERVGTAGPIDVRDVRSLEVAAGHHRLDPALPPTRFVDGPESRIECFERGGDQCRAQPRDAVGKVRFERVDHVVGGQRGTGKPGAGVSVDLQIQQCRGDQWPVVDRTRRPGRHDPLDPALGDLDRDRLGGVVASCLNGEAHGRVSSRVNRAWQSSSRVPSGSVTA